MSNMLTLMTSDKQEFTIEESIAVQSELIRNLVEDECAASTVPLPNVTGKTMAMIIDYWKKHSDSALSQDDLKKFDSEFVDKPISDLFPLVQAADYLNIKDLLDITCQKIADSIKDKMPEEVREIFNIQNDFTPEEEAEIRKEYAWAFEI